MKMYVELLWLTLSLAIFWTVWNHFWRRFIMEKLRQELFDLRDELFMDAANGRHGLGFDSVAYQQTRASLNSQIAYCHMFSYRLLASVGNWKPVPATWRERLNAETRSRIEAVEAIAAKKVTQFLLLRSLPLAGATVVIVLLAVLPVVAVVVFRAWKGNSKPGASILGAILGAIQKGYEVFVPRVRRALVNIPDRTGPLPA